MSFDAVPSSATLPGFAGKAKHDYHRCRASTSVDVHIGKRLRELRKLRDLSQTDLAKRVEISFQQIQKYESGRNRISAGRLWTMSVILEESPLYFFAGLDTPSVEQALAS